MNSFPHPHFLVRACVALALRARAQALPLPPRRHRSLCPHPGKSVSFQIVLPFRFQLKPGGAPRVAPP